MHDHKCEKCGRVYFGNGDRRHVCRFAPAPEPDRTRAMFAEMERERKAKVTARLSELRRRKVGEK